MKTLPRLGVLLLAAALAGVSSAQTPASNPAAVPTLRNDWLNRHNGFVAIAQQGNVDLLFVGDSITDGWRQRGRALWTEHYEPLKAANFGIGGDRTEHVLWRLQNGEMNGIRPKVAVVMIGTNNTGRDSARQIAEGITAIVREIHKHSPATKVLLLAIFPKGERPDNAGRIKVGGVNRIIASLDDGRTVFFHDIGDKFLAADGTLPASIMPDFLHPNEEGYRIWSDAMAEKLATLLR